MPTRKPVAKHQPAAKPPKPAQHALEPAAPTQSALPKRGRGQPSYVPTGEGAAWVRYLAAGGVLQERIAALLNISVPTLRKHYGTEIRIARSRIDALSISTLVAAMQGGGKEAVTAAIWWQKARMGWTERVMVDDGKPADVPMRVIIELVGDAPAKTIDHEQPRQRTGLDIGKHVQLVGP